MSANTGDPTHAQSVGSDLDFLIDALIELIRFNADEDEDEDERQNEIMHNRKTL